MGSQLEDLEKSLDEQMAYFDKFNTYAVHQHTVESFPFSLVVKNSDAGLVLTDD